MPATPPLVVCLLQCSNLGGMEQVAYQLLHDMTRAGIARFRVASGRPAGPGWDRVLAIDPHAQAFDYRGRFGWRTVPAYRRWIRENATGAASLWIVGTDACSLMASRGLRMRRVLSHHYHHLENGRGGTRWRLFYSLLCRDLAAITYPTAFTRGEAVAIAPWLEERAHVVRNGFTFERTAAATRAARRAAARAQLGLPADAFIVGNGGWLIRRKRFDVFLRTAALVAARVPHAHFVICGDGEERAALEALARELGIAERVVFTGWVQGLRPYYQAWDVCLFNSDFDTLPCSPMESAAEGCPVVASLTYGGLGEFLRDGENGFLCRTHDTETLARHICAIAADPALAERLVQAGHDILEHEFSQADALAWYRRHLLPPVA